MRQNALWVLVGPHHASACENRLTKQIAATETSRVGLEISRGSRKRQVGSSCGRQSGLTEAFVQEVREYMCKDDLIL